MVSSPRTFIPRRPEKTILPLSFSNPSILSGRTTRFSRGSITTSAADTTRPSFFCPVFPRPNPRALPRPTNRSTRKPPNSSEAGHASPRWSWTRAREASTPCPGPETEMPFKRYAVWRSSIKCSSARTMAPRAIKSNGIWRTNVPFWI